VFSETRRLKELLFVDALRCIGVTNARIMFFHILPNTAVDFRRELTRDFRREVTRLHVWFGFQVLVKVGAFSFFAAVV
jgi:ABC-type microcin C transport system permease subunit YejE